MIRLKLRRGPCFHETPQAVPDGSAVQVCSKGSRRGWGAAWVLHVQGAAWVLQAFRACAEAVSCLPSDPGRCAVSPAARGLASASPLLACCFHHLKGGYSTGPSSAPSISVRSRHTRPNLDPFLQKNSEQLGTPDPSLPDFSSLQRLSSGHSHALGWVWAQGPKRASAWHGDDEQSHKHLQSRKRVTYF